jgi:hypothetical protein
MSVLSTAYLTDNLFGLKVLEQKPTRKGYGQGLLEAGEKDSRVVVLCADLTEQSCSYLTGVVLGRSMKILTPLPSRLAGTAVFL